MNRSILHASLILAVASVCFAGAAAAQTAESGLNGNGWEMLSSAPVDGGSATERVVESASSSGGWQVFPNAPQQPVTSGQNVVNTPNVPQVPHDVPPNTATQPLEDPQSQPEIGSTQEPFELEAGLPLGLQLAAWAKRAGYGFEWRYPDDWLQPNHASYGSDFPKAIQAALDDAGKNGADIYADGWKGNKSIIVTARGAGQ